MRHAQGRPSYGRGARVFGPPPASCATSRYAWRAPATREGDPRWGGGGGGLGPPARRVCDEPVRVAGPRAQQRARVTRVDDLLDPEALRGAEGRAHRVEPRLDLRPQRDRVVRSF